MRGVSGGTMVRMIARIGLALGLVAAGLCAEPATLAIPAEVRSQFKLADFYQKGLVLEGFPIVASNEVRDEALLEAGFIVQHMLVNRPDILRAMAANNVRLAIMGVNQRTRDIPEHSDLGEFWDRRARGVGSTPQRPAVSAAEENLLNLPGDPYRTENILIHEFAHAIHEMGMNTIDPTFERRLNEAYKAALEKGLWKGTYAAVRVGEYWAEGVQDWFNCNAEGNGIHNHVNTRAELQEYDPALAALCQEVFGDNPWTYVRADDPSRAGKEHLSTLDRAKLPAFNWEWKRPAKGGN